MVHLGVPEARQEILGRIALVTTELRPRWGRMSAHQMICHLNDSFLVAMGERYASPATGLFRNPVLKWIALHTPLPWAKNVPTRPEVDQTAGGTPPGDFVRDRARLAELIGRFAEPSRNFAFAPHPMWGEMREHEWLRWGYRHTDHHLRQFDV